MAGFGWVILKHRFRIACACGVLEPPGGGGGGRGGLHMRAWRSRQARPRRRAASAATDAGAAGAVCALMTSESAGKSLLRLARVSQRASMRAQRGHSKRLHHRSKPRPRKERHALMIEPESARSLPSASCPKRGRLHPRAQPTEEQVQGRKQGKRKEKRSSKQGKRKEKRSSRNMLFSLFSFQSQPIAPWRRRHEKKKQSRKNPVVFQKK